MVYITKMLIEGLINKHRFFNYHIEHRLLNYNELLTYLPLSEFAFCIIEYIT